MNARDLVSRLQLPFQGVRLHTLLVRSKNETTYPDHVWQVEPLH